MLSETPTLVAKAAAAGKRRAAIMALKLTRYRNYATLTLPLAGASVVLTGQNGAGKTNLLEAVSLLSPGRGIRGARLDEIAMKGGGTFAVAARVANAAGEVDLGTGVVAGPIGAQSPSDGCMSTMRRSARPRRSSIISACSG